MDKQARDRLRALTDVPRNGSPVAFVASLQRNELRALLDALDAAERDAARYRRLREGIVDADLRYVLAIKRVGGDTPPVMLLHDAFDARVDAAMGEQTGEGGGTT